MWIYRQSLDSVASLISPPPRLRHRQDLSSSLPIPHIPQPLAPMGNQPSSPADRLLIDSPSTIALKEGDHYRYLAREEQRFRNECEEEARQARESGFGASELEYGRSKSNAISLARFTTVAAEMTRQSQVHDKRMKLYNEEAAKIIYNANNNLLTSPQRILLHGLSIDEALTRVRERLFLLATSTTQPRLRDLTIVTGLPRLDGSLLSIVQPTVQSLIQEHDLDVEYDQPNEGCVFVQLNWSADDTGNVFDAIPVHAPTQPDDDDLADGDTVVDEDEFPRQGTPLDARLRKEGYEGPGPSLRARQEYRDAVRNRIAGEESPMGGWGGVVAAVGAVALAGLAIYKSTSGASSGKKRGE
ncbi:hypothetical protein BC938DRAFT_481983 [Jimgerdemannia flammicorona]|uniref:Smr domain-containing protein n=1 Tax=Jimgerdemannia flammicorona TaxID=994334 RepID=A0A433QF19_9FUNG|nr:hypothetical protein BC938DRAFT_481983 [Jimgerdemannia flammicorona]